MYKYLLIALCCLPFTSSAQRDTVYFVKEETITHDKSRATFFRPPMVQEGDKCKVTDYFMDGKLRDETYSLSLDSALFMMGTMLDITRMDTSALSVTI